MIDSHVCPICSWCLSLHILSSENISFLTSLYCLVDYMLCFAFLMLLWASNIHAHSLQQMVTQISICCKLSATVHCFFLSTSCIILSYTLIPHVINTTVSYILYIYIWYSFKFSYCVHMFSMHVSECILCMYLCVCASVCAGAGSQPIFSRSLCIVCSSGTCTGPEAHSFDPSG